MSIKHRVRWGGAKIEELGTWKSGPQGVNPLDDVYHF